LATFATVG